MRKVISTSIIIFAFCFTSLMAQTEKEQSIKDYRIYYSQHLHRGHELNADITLSECISLLQNDGKFSDLVQAQTNIESNNYHLSSYSGNQSIVSDLNGKAFNRLWLIAEEYRKTTISNQLSDAALQKLFKGFINYGQLELSRANVPGGRFHTSCFAIPTAAINSYFALFELMEKIEAGTITDALAVQLNSVLKDVGMQSWTQPYRNDATDLNVVQVDRFRNHVWWVGGNGLGFRSVLPACFMMSSIEMVDVLSAVGIGALSSVSQNTHNEAFWTEGFTADGAGWGHGMQCNLWGYPLSGTSAALNMITLLKGSPWAKDLEPKNKDAMLNYVRGSSWYYYNGYIPPCLDRANMLYKGVSTKTIPSKSLANSLISNWSSSLSDNQISELNLFVNNAGRNKFTMEGMPKGYYTGTRWFFNNDNLIKKTADYYAFISMASVRCDGIESSHTIADKYNFYTCDGMTFLEKSGTEYLQAIGGWNLTSVPGATSRQGEEKLTPIKNWRGFCSMHNFAAAATNGSENAASGFIFEKINASSKNNDITPQTSTTENEIIYGVKAYKSYFMFGDYMLALGAGITNKRADKTGEVWTTIDQTLWQGDARWKSTSSNGTFAFGGGDNTIELKSVSDNSNTLIWAKQNHGFSYAVMPNQTTGSVHLSTETRATKWEKLNPNNVGKTNLPATVDMFHLWINHGQTVKNGRYGYLVYMGSDNTLSSFDQNPVKVLSNDTSIQAASTLNEKTVGATFYSIKDTLKTSSWQMQVSSPCAVLVEQGEMNCTITVTDALMDANLAHIEVRTTLPLRGADISYDGDWSVVKVNMPQGNMCGKPASIVCELDQAGIPWSETFNMTDDITNDDGNTAWSITTSNTQANGYAKVLNGGFEIKGTACIWQSADIDISDEKGVDINIDLSVLNGENLSSENSVGIYYILDGEAQQKIAVLSGNIQQQTIQKKNLSGNSLKVVVEVKNNSSNAAYILDNIIVKSKSNPRLSSLKINNSIPANWTPETLSIDFGLVNANIPKIEGASEDESVTIEIKKTSKIPGTAEIIATDILGDVTRYTINLAIAKASSYHETFEKMTKTGWSSETYTGDHGFEWTINAKSVSGYITSRSKCIYMSKDKVGAQSGVIAGGISSCSVSCKDLWDEGSERTLQLFINGEVVNTFTHTGTDIYTCIFENINIAGDITIGIKNASVGSSNMTIAIDDIKWTGLVADKTTTLAEILIDGVPLAEFNSDIYSYSITTSVIPAITATPTSSKSTVTISHPTTFANKAQIKVTAESGDYALYYISFNNPSTRMVNHSDLNDFRIYPNPSTGILYLENLKDIDNIKVYSVEGKLIMNKQVSTTSTSLNISDHPKGIYLAMFEYNSGKIERRKIIMK